MADATGMQHFRHAEVLLASLVGDVHNDAEWQQAIATRALAHAQLAAAARDYGLHAAPRLHPSQAEPAVVPHRGGELADPTVVIPRTRFDDKLRARDVQELNRMLTDDD